MPCTATKLVVWVLLALSVEAQLQGISTANSNQTLTDVQLIERELEGAKQRLAELKQQEAQMEHESLEHFVTQLTTHKAMVSRAVVKAMEEASQHNLQLAKRLGPEERDIKLLQSLVHGGETKEPGKMVRVLLRWILLVSTQIVTIKGFIDDPFRCPADFPDLFSSIAINLAGTADIANELTSLSDPDTAHIPGIALNLVATLTPLYMTVKRPNFGAPSEEHTQHEPSGTGLVMLILGGLIGTVALVLAGFLGGSLDTSRLMLFIAAFFVAVMPFHEVVTTRNTVCANKMGDLGRNFGNWRLLGLFFVVFVAAGQTFVQAHSANNPIQQLKP